MRFPPRGIGNRVDELRADLAGRGNGGARFRDGRRDRALYGGADAVLDGGHGNSLEARPQATRRVQLSTARGQPTLACGPAAHRCRMTHRLSVGELIAAITLLLDGTPRETSLPSA